MPHLSHERIRRRLDETECDWCASPLYTGDRVVYDLAAGAAYCCTGCAQEDGADRGHGGGPLTSADGLAGRYAAARERIGNDPDDDQAEADRVAARMAEAAAFRARLPITYAAPTGTPGHDAGPCRAS